MRNAIAHVQRLLAWGAESLGPAVGLRLTALQETLETPLVAVCSGDGSERPRQTSPTVSTVA